MGGKTFWVEEKLDGERIQLHKRGREFRFFSRYGCKHHITLTVIEKLKITHTSMGAALMMRKVLWLVILTPLLLTVVTSNTLLNSGLNYRVILDGEMIAWDPLNQAIIPFGNLKTAALTEKENRSSEDGIRPLCTGILFSAKWKILLSISYISIEPLWLGIPWERDETPFIGSWTPSVVASKYMTSEKQIRYKTLKVSWGKSSQRGAFRDHTSVDIRCEGLVVKVGPHIVWPHI